MPIKISSSDLLITLQFFMDNQFNGFNASMKDLSCYQKLAFIKACIPLIEHGWSGQPEKYWSKLNDESKYFFNYILQYFFNQPKKIFRKNLSHDAHVVIKFFTKLNLFNHVVSTLEDHQLFNLIARDNKINLSWFLKMHTNFEQDFEFFEKKYANNNLSIDKVDFDNIYKLKKFLLTLILIITTAYLATAIANLFDYKLSPTQLLVLAGSIGLTVPIFLLDSPKPKPNVGRVFANSDVKKFFIITPKKNLLKIIDNRPVSMSDSVNNDPSVTLSN